MPVTTIAWDDGMIRMIDQTRLPGQLIYLEIRDIPTLAEAIRSLRVRGAPAIGVAAAFGLLLAAEQSTATRPEAFFDELQETAELLRNTRPTAVNLGWALDHMLEAARAARAQGVTAMRTALRQKAMALYKNDQTVNRKLAEYGASLIPDPAEIITHCNTGALATVDYGTALGAVFTAHAQGKKVHVWVDETRPLLQGARLNMWELQHEGIPATLICDNTAAFVMARREISLCIVGADRIAANGDTANKIGTYALALAAKHHGVPFYIAAPCSTIDPAAASGEDIPVEERGADEIVNGFGRRTAPEGARVYAPAFDITPNELITAIITEKGVHTPPFTSSLPSGQKTLD